MKISEKDFKEIINMPFTQENVEKTLLQYQLLKEKAESILNEYAKITRNQGITCCSLNNIDVEYSYNLEMDNDYDIYYDDLEFKGEEYLGYGEYQTHGISLPISYLWDNNWKEELKLKQKLKEEEEEKKRLQYEKERKEKFDKKEYEEYMRLKVKFGEVSC
jgi:hypothetical protein